MILLTLASAAQPANPRPWWEGPPAIPLGLQLTRYETVDRADVVVVAQVVRDANAHPVYVVTEVLKGTGLTVGGQFTTAWMDSFGQSRPRELDTFSFASDAHVELDRHYVFMLTAGPQFFPLHQSRVELSGDAWLQAVRHYSTISALGDYEREKRALHKLLERARAGDADTSPALATDLENHFREPTPAKSQADLEALYRDDPADANTRTQAVLAIGATASPEAAGFMEDRLIEFSRGQFDHLAQGRALMAVGYYYERLPSPRLGPLIYTVFLAGAHGPASGFLAHALLMHVGAEDEMSMLRAYRESPPDTAHLLVDYFVWFPSERAHRKLHHMLGARYFERQQLTIDLAIIGDREVVNWAIATLRTAPKKSGWSELDLAECVLQESPLPAARAALSRLRP